MHMLSLKGHRLEQMPQRKSAVSVSSEFSELGEPQMSASLVTAVTLPGKEALRKRIPAASHPEVGESPSQRLSPQLFETSMSDKL